MEVTREELIELFTTWRRDTKDSPDWSGTDEEFGTAAADHLLKMKEERDGA